MSNGKYKTDFTLLLNRMKVPICVYACARDFVFFIVRVIWIIRCVPFREDSYILN